MADGPAMLGQYELCGLLGEGGIGQVHAALDTVLGRQVAIKMLRPELARDDNFVDRFYTEAKSLATLNHSNITTLYSLHTEGPEAYMVMELVNGQTLEALLAKVGHLTLRDSLAILAQAVPGLRYAHRRGVVHRDLKPANLMLTDDGQVKIMDFGIARVQGSQHLTRVGEFCGTFVYASPEQIRGDEVDERSDLYSLAIVFYRMLVGEAPFAATNEYALMTAHLQTPPPSLAGRVADLGADTEAVLMRALAKKPEDRFASVEEFGKAIGATALRGESVEILTQLYAHAFGKGGDIEATRVVTSGRSRPPADPTPPSNRRTWQLPAMGSNETMVLSRPSVAAPHSNPAVRRAGTAPAPVSPAVTDAFRPAPAILPTADTRRHVRPWLMGVSAVTISLALGGGYYLAFDSRSTAPVHEVSDLSVPKPATPDPASIEPAVTHEAPATPTPAVTDPLTPSPVKTAEAEAPPVSPVIDTPKPAPIVVPPAMSTEPAPPPVAQLPPLPPPPPPVPPAPVIQPSPPPPIPPVPPIATIDPVPPPVSKTGVVISPPPVVPVPPVVIAPPPIPDLPPDRPKVDPVASGGDLKVAALEPKTPEPPPLGPQPPAGPPKPEGEPDLLGKVTGAKGLDELELSGRWIKLYGIVDSARGYQESGHVQVLLSYLRPAHGIVVCYRKPAGTHRCYADGHDIAALALRDGLVRPSLNAPAEYRSPLVQQR